MADSVVSYVGISDRIAYRKLILLSSKDIITALNTYEQIKVIRKKKLELMKQIDENINSIVKVKEKLERSFPISAYDALIKSVKVKEEEKSTEKDFEKYLTKMKGAHKTTKKTTVKKAETTHKAKSTKITAKKIPATKAVIEEIVEKEVVKPVEKNIAEVANVEHVVEEKKEVIVEAPKVQSVMPPKKVTRFEKLQKELEDIESKLSNL